MLAISMKELFFSRHLLIANVFELQEKCSGMKRALIFTSFYRWMRRFSMLFAKFQKLSEMQHENWL